MKNFRAAIRHALVLSILGVALAAPPARAQESFSDEALLQLRALYQERDSWTASERKMDSHLVMESKSRLGKSMASGLPQLRSRARVDASDRALVDIKATVTQDVLDAITQLGGEIVSSVPRFDAIRAAIPFEYLETFASHPDVVSIRQADGFMTNKTNVSEGDGAHRADVARTDYGVNGAGVSIGVISDGVDSLVPLQGTGDLPPGVIVLPGQAGSGSEGTAMLEIVFDLAPSANLFFATAFNSQADFAQNILNLQAAGCQVIVDDIFYFAEPVFQDGVIAQAVETVTAAGSSYFSAIGNEGNLNDGTAGVYESDFVGVSVPVPGEGTFTAHLFGIGQPTDLITSDPPFVITLHWADAIGQSSNNYDLVLVDGALTQILDVSMTIQDGNDDPFEQIASFGINDTGNRLAVIQTSGEDRYFHLNTLRGQLQFATNGQAAGHPATDNAFGIAAVDISSAPGADGSPFDGTEPVESFSSDGPRRVFFEADGTPITPGDFSSTGGVVRDKPDFAAADGVSTATPGFNPFFGTSAAAPHAAALAALLIDAGIFTTPDQIRTAFADTALDIEAPGFDRDSGFGIIDINGALGIACDFALGPPSALIPADGVVNGVINITTDASCPWTATSNANFITLTSANFGAGNSAISYTVAPNNGVGRVGTISVADQTFTVTQQACAIPSSVVNPMSQAGCIGGSVTFSAIGAGTAPLGIEWQVDEGIGFKSIPGENGPTLTVNNITQAMNGFRYHAVFYNGCGDSATAPAILTVGQPGTPASVSATNGVFPDRVHVQWSPVVGATSYRVFRSAQSNGSGGVDISGAITALEFDDFTATTEMTTGCSPMEVGIKYRYYVVATNICGDGSASASATGAIADPAKISASLRPSNLGDLGVLLVTLAAMYAYQRRRKIAVEQ